MFAAFREVRQLRAHAAALDKMQAIIVFELDGRIRDANALFLSTMGYARAEIVGRHHRLFVDPQDSASQAYADFWKSLRQGRADVGMYQRLRKDGGDVRLQASYQPVLDYRGRTISVEVYGRQ